VFGGKGHEFVVDLAGVVARQSAVTHHRVPMYAHQAASLADAAAFRDVLQDRTDFLLRQGRAEQRRPLALGKPGLAGSAAEHPPLFVRPIATAYRQVFAPAFPVVGARGILTTKPRQIAHDRPSMTQSPD
jgi:hypothetical protein